MRRVPSEASAAARAHWLAAMAQTLGEAQMLAWQLGMDRGDSDAMALYARIEAAIAEVQALRLGGRRESRPEIDPDWTQIAPWTTR